MGQMVDALFDKITNDASRIHNLHIKLGQAAEKL
jgi:hypothetical protein